MWIKKFKKVPQLTIKIALAVIIIFMAGGSAFIYFAHQTGFQMLERQAYTRAEDIASLVKSIFYHLMLIGKHDRVQVLLEKSISSPAVANAFILKKDGTVVMSAKNDSTMDPFPLHRLQEVADLKDGKYFSQKEGDLYYLYVVSPIKSTPACYQCHKNPTSIEDYFAIKVAMNDLKSASLQHRRTNILITTVTFIGIGGVLFAALALLVVKPLKKLQRHVHQIKSQVENIAEGRPRPFPLIEHSKGNDEIAELSRGFNDLILRLNEAKARLYEMHQWQLQQADRLATTGEMAAGIAHEIKNPIAGIVGALQVLKSDYPVFNSKHEIINEMLSQLDRMDQSVNDLLSYARPKPPELSSVRVHEIVERTLTLLSHLLEKNNIKIETHLNASDARIFADTKQIQQVLWNILLNAVQAIEKDGIISISTLKQGDNVHIVVKDSGAGISDEHLSNIFKPFYTTKHKGTGLGLPICKQIIEEHRGNIVIDTIVGAGTTVKITLPLHK